MAQAGPGLVEQSRQAGRRCSLRHRNAPYARAPHPPAAARAHASPDGQPLKAHGVLGAELAQAGLQRAQRLDLPPLLRQAHRKLAAQLHVGELEAALDRGAHLHAQGRRAARSA